MKFYAKTAISPIEVKPMSVEESKIRSLYMQAKEEAKDRIHGNSDIGGAPYVELIKLFREFVDGTSPIGLKDAKDAIDRCCGETMPEGQRQEKMYSFRFNDEMSIHNILNLFHMHSSSYEIPVEKETVKKLVDEKGMEVIRSRFNEEIAKKQDTISHTEKLAEEYANSAHIWSLAVKVVESNSVKDGDGKMLERFRTIIDTLMDECNHAQEEANNYAREARNALAQIETLQTALKIVEDVVNQGVK